VGLVSLGSLFILPLLSQPNAYLDKPVSDVKFVGLRNVTADDLYPLLLTQFGQPLTEEALNADLKALFATGYFSNVLMRVRLTPEGGVAVTYEVSELPRIQSIKFLGAEELALQELKTVLDFREGDVYSAQKVKAAVQLLENKYREEGFFLSEIWYRVSRVDRRSNQISVSYIIDEGANIPISKINLLGAKQLDPEDLLDILDQQESGLLDDGLFQETKFEEDKFKILAYAKSRGFLDAEIDPRATGYEIRYTNPRRPEEGRVVIITYKLLEGEISYFGGYSLDHDPRSINQELNPPEREVRDDITPIYNPDVLIRSMEFSEADVGEIFDEGRFFRDRGSLQELYSTQGYVFTQIQPVYINMPFTKETLDKYEACAAVESPTNATDLRCKTEAEWLDLPALRERLVENPEEEGRNLRHVHFVVRENGLAYIENIIIKGYVKTQENVIRRELLVKEGQLFNSALVNRSREKLINLGYFKEVNLQIRPGSSEDKMNLILDVTEQPTGTISMGGGFGTQSGFSIFTEVGENNLGGAGEKISGRLEYGPLRRSVGIEWTDPWFYETCEDSTGSFWRNKMSQFDEAQDFATILKTAESLQNQYRSIGAVIATYVDEADGDESLESLDRVKVRVRRLIFKYVAEEEECYRSYPRPWSLRLGAFYQSTIFQDVSPLAVSFDSTDLFEDAEFERNRFGLDIGTSHSFLVNWAHYHSYSPSWSVATRPTSLVNDAVLQEVDLGWQFKSSFTNGVIYNTIDNVFNPTQGFRANHSIEITGQALGGDDHFNRYTASYNYYWWWFDYTFFGFFRNNNLRRWRVVQEVRLKGTFTHETAPFRSTQDKEENPYIEPEDRLYLGGFNTLRGFDPQDDLYPAVWRDGGSHMLLGSTEFRVPIEPSILWLVAFLDSGTVFDNVGEYTGDLKESAENYQEVQNLATARADRVLALLADQTNPLTFFQQGYHFRSLRDWNDPKRAVLSTRNLALDRALYSWGFGLRIQIPVLPLRLFLAQKLYYAGGGKFKPIPGEDQFEFVFGIGDVRF
jgi:outer membrane protein assembly complex protein YaeT